MKTILLSILACLFTILGFSQIELQPNPSNINSGTFTFKYGEFGDYSIFDPLGNPNLYLYTGLQTDADPITWDYNDGEFTIENLGQMIPLTYDNDLGYYITTFNPKTRQYVEDVTEMLTTIPNGIEVFDWYFLITTDDLSRQSPDLRGSDYGFNAAVLSISEITVKDDFFTFDDNLKFLKPGSYTIATYDALGKLMSRETIVVNDTTIHELQLESSGLYIVEITSGLSTKTLKILKQ